MNLRQAIFMAADHIEQNPREYEFESCRKPACGTPGCLLGWVGHFASIEDSGSSDYMQDVAEVLGHTWQDLSVIAHENELYGYTYKPDRAAELLRLYADKHHPAPKAHGIPSSVRAIFETKQTEAAIQAGM